MPIDLNKLTPDQLDLLESYHTKGIDQFSEDELNRLQDIIRGPTWGQWAAEKGLGAAKAIGTGLAQIPGAVADVLNPTSQIGAEPDLRKGIPESWKGVNLTDPRATAPLPQEDTSFAGQIGKAIGHEPQNKLEEYLQSSTTGAGVAALQPMRAIGPLARAIYQGAAPAVASKFAGETAGALGAGPTTQKWTRFLTGLFSPYVATRARTPLPVSDPERRTATQTLKGAGIKTTAGQDTGRAWLQNIEGAKFGPARNEQQSKQFTRAVTRELGQPTEAATIGTGGYLPQVGRDIKQNMDNVSSRNDINLGVMSPQERFDLQSHLEQLARNNPRHVKPILDLIEQHTGWKPNMVGAPVVANPTQAAAERIWRTLYPGARVISGEDYQRLRSQLFSSAGKIAKSDPTLAESYRETARALDKGMRYSISRQNPNDLGAFENARQLLENNMIVERAMKGNKGSAQIQPNKLETAARRVVGDRRYNAGDTPYQPLATAAQKAMPKLPEKGHTEGWHAALPAAALGGVAAVAAPTIALLKGVSPYHAMETVLPAGFGTGMAAAIPQYLGHKIAPTRLGQRYLRNQAVPALSENAAARLRNALAQGAIAGNAPQKKVSKPKIDMNSDMNRPQVPLR